MSDTTPPFNDSTEQQETPEWQRIEEIQHLLSKALRQHDAGRSVDGNKILADLMSKLSQASQETAEETTQINVTGTQLVDDYWSHVSKHKICATTGFAKLNDMLGGGLEAGRLMVLLGAPGGGKTTFANQVGVHVANSGRPVLYVTSEDVPQTLLAKTLARQGKINYKAVLKGWDNEKEKINRALAEYRMSLASERLRYLDATMGIDVTTIHEHAKKHFEKHKDAGQGVLIVDYLQNLARNLPAYRNGNMELRNAVTLMSKELRSIATGLDCCVLALGSMGRASGYEGADNVLSAGKESGDIEYTADVVFGIVHDKNRVPGASWLQARRLLIDKNRQGEAGVIKLNWYGAQQEMTEASEDDNQIVEESVNGGNGRKRGR